MFESINNVFTFWDESKLKNIKNFQKPTVRKEMSFDNFVTVLFDSNSHSYFICFSKIEIKHHIKFIFIFDKVIIIYSNN